MAAAYILLGIGLVFASLGIMDLKHNDFFFV